MQKGERTVETEDGRVEGRGFGEAELDDVVLGASQQCLGLLLLLEHRLLAAVLLLLPRQRLLLLRFLEGDGDNNNKFSILKK